MMNFFFNNNFSDVFLNVKRPEAYIS